MQTYNYNTDNTENTMETITIKVDAATKERLREVAAEAKLYTISKLVRELWRPAVEGTKKSRAELARKLRKVAV